ncbi:MAG TPA: TolC family protein [Polyangia bacterium]
MRTDPKNIRAYLLSATIFCTVWASGLLVLFCPSPAHALQPLTDFFSASHKASTDARQAALVTVQREADELIATSQLLPSVAASGSYTLNQFESVISMGQGSIVIQPRHGLSGSAQLSIPLLDLASWRRKKAADRVVEAARLSQETTALEVDRQVAQYYFQLIGAEALRRSYQSSLAAAEESYSVTVAKREEGVATDLDVARATVEVEGIRRSLAEQQLSIALARRALTTLTGVVPSADVPEVADDLHGEARLGAWEERILQLPSIRGAAASTEAAHEQARAARLALLPTVAATATEQVTNAAGLVGHESYFTGMVTASWRLDLAALARRKGQGAAEQAARVQEEATANRARDAVHEAWQRVDSGIMASQSARSQAAAARLAADKARERYAAGAGTQLELIQAQRDLSSMEASRIQSDANLALDRILLRLAVGER